LKIRLKMINLSVRLSPRGVPPTPAHADSDKRWRFHTPCDLHAHEWSPSKNDCISGNVAGGGVCPCVIGK
jgi:hypothetical protein